MSSSIRLLLKSIVGVTLALFLSACIFVIGLVSVRPLVTVAPDISSENVVEGTRMLKRTQKMLSRTGHPQTYRASLIEINSVFAFVTKRFKTFNGNANLDDNRINLKATIKLPVSNELYINAQASVNTDSKFYWRDSKIGSISLPDTLANWLFKFIGTRFLHSQFGTLLENNIDSVNVETDRVIVKAQFPVELPGSLQGTLRQLGGISKKDQAQLVKSSKFYLDHLTSTYLVTLDGDDQLSTYLNSLSTVIAKRVYKEKTDFKQEFTAALFSLAFAMEPSIMGPFLPELKSPDPSFNQIQLGGRSDFAKHFVLSAVLEILTNKNVAFALGEVKELLDSSRNSGYSLQDIAADKAGIYFVKSVVTRETVAQRYLSSTFTLDDTDYFPDVMDLDEGMTEQEFKQRYSSTQSELYLSKIEKIDQRLHNLPLYIQ